MKSRPGATSTGTMWPGSLVAKASSPREPIARYSIMKIDPPPATRFNTPNSPTPPENWVCVVIWIELPIHDSSPASEMMDSFGSRMNSRTGMVVPVMRLCIVPPSVSLETIKKMTTVHACTRVTLGEKPPFLHSPRQGYAGTGSGLKTGCANDNRASANLGHALGTFLLLHSHLE